MRLTDGFLRHLDLLRVQVVSAVWYAPWNAQTKKPQRIEVRSLFADEREAEPESEPSLIPVVVERGNMVKLTFRKAS